MKKSKKQNRPENNQQFNETLRRMLNTPPQPQKKSTKK